MDIITSLLDGLDKIGELVPPLDQVLGDMSLWVSIFLLIGPLMLLGLGIWYLLAPPKEANRKAGFRTYFGMGSVEAWQFTQRIAGMVWGGLGILLTVIMGIICLTLQNKDGFQMAQTAVNCLIWQVVLAAVAYLGICITATIFFDKDGNRRK